VARCKHPTSHADRIREEKLRKRKHLPPGNVARRKLLAVRKRLIGGEGQ
jgi:hypothetical protein